MRRSLHFLAGFGLLLAGCSKLGSGIDLGSNGFASHRIVVVDFNSPRASFFSPDFPGQHFPKKVFPFKGEETEFDDFSLRAFAPPAEMKQIDCSISKMSCVVIGQDVGLDSNAYYQFPISQEFVSFVGECEKKNGNFEDTRSFFLDRKKVPELKKKLYEKDILVNENKLGHTVDSVLSTTLSGIAQGLRNTG